jgi:putative tricarboxylic transport membrane protein
MWKPQREVEVIAGTPPGGGLDRSARALVAATEKSRLLDVPINVVNVGGDGGRKAWLRMEGHAGDAHALGISSPNMRADYLIGVSKSDPDRFAPLAILYSEYIAFLVRTDSPIASGANLVRRFADERGTLTVALSTSLGNSNHIAVAKVIHHAGSDAKPPIRVFDSALDALADVLAGNSDVAAVTAASAVADMEAGRLRAVAVSSPARLPGPYAGTPTWQEQSWRGRAVDCVVASWRGASGPPQLAPEQIAFWRFVLSSAVRSAQWRSDLVRHFWTDMYLDGEALRDYLERERVEMQEMLSQLGLIAKERTRDRASRGDDA